MHAIDLADLATTLVRCVAAQYSLGQAPSPKAQQDYWLTVRYRHENWIHELSRHRDAIQRPGTSRRVRLWHDIVPIIQEILLSEPLTRVVAYHAAVLEQRTIDCDFRGLADSALSTHIEARNRCLNLIVFGPGMSVENTVHLNRLRRAAESFTDQLFTYLPAIPHPARLCFDPTRLRRNRATLSITAWQTCWISLHAMALSEGLWSDLSRQMDWRAGSAQLNYRIAQHVLALLPSACFDSLGIPHSVEMGRLIGPSAEAQVGPSHPHPLCDSLLCKPAAVKRYDFKVDSRRLHDN